MWKGGPKRPSEMVEYFSKPDKYVTGGLLNFSFGVF
jgi:hypothetical protein